MSYQTVPRPAALCQPSVSRSSSCGLNRFPTKIKTPIFSYYRLPTVGLSLQTGSTTAASGGQRHADAHHPSRPPPTRTGFMVDTPAVGLTGSATAGQRHADAHHPLQAAPHPHRLYGRYARRRPHRLCDSGSAAHADAHHPSRPPPTPATLVDTPAVGLTGSATAGQRHADAHHPRPPP